MKILLNKVRKTILQKDKYQRTYKDDKKTKQKKEEVNKKIRERNYSINILYKKYEKKFIV